MKDIKNKLPAVFSGSFGSMALSVLCVTVFDLIFAFSGLWLAGMTAKRIFVFIIFGLIFVFLMGLMFYYGRKLFVMHRGIALDFLSVCVIPAVMLGILFLLSRHIGGAAADVLQYPYRLAMEVFFQNIPADNFGRIIYAEVFLQNLLCWLMIFAGVCYEKKHGEK